MSKNKETIREQTRLRRLAEAGVKDTERPRSGKPRISFSDLARINS